ncbi:hypothetical protein AcV5_003385 [Taiwanofungus camphoratus]|nr:hypothetical protein AcV5_003385 [Antrodia cinnamomea]
MASSYSTSYDPTGLFSFPHYIDNTSPVDQTYIAGASYIGNGASDHPRPWQSHAPSYPSLSLDSGSPFSTPPVSSHMAYPADYPESSQRTVLSGQSFASATSSSPSPSSSRSFASMYSQPSPTHTPTLQRALRSSGLYAIAGDESAQQSGDGSQPPSHVKTEEEPEDVFIFEAGCPIGRSSTLTTAHPSSTPAVLAPHRFVPRVGPCSAHAQMAEVPLRATGASREMRKMMGAFRLDPFAMHNGIRSAAVAAPPAGIEIGPLREEPVMLEFQVHLDHAPGAPPACWSPGRSPSPLLYPLEDDPEDKWAPALETYPAFEHGENDSGEFAPLLTPAQSLHWSMSCPPGDAHADPVQPLSIFRAAQPASAHALSLKAADHHHAHHDSTPYLERDAYRSYVPSQPRPSALRCQQEYTGYTGIPAGTLAWFRKTLVLSDSPYTACT